MHFIQTERESRLISRLRFWSKMASIATVAIGSIVILGWIFDIAILKSVLPGWVAMKANTAFGLIFGGSSLWLQHHNPRDRSCQRIVRLFSAIVLAIGLLTLVEYVLQVDLGIDGLVFKEAADAVGTSLARAHGSQ